MYAFAQTFFVMIAIASGLSWLVVLFVIIDMTEKETADSKLWVTRHPMVTLIVLGFICALASGMVNYYAEMS